MKKIAINIFSASIATLLIVQHAHARRFLCTSRLSNVATVIEALTPSDAHMRMFRVLLRYGVEDSPLTFTGIRCQLDWFGTDHGRQ